FDKMSDYSFRILILGDTDVGKSALFTRAFENRFIPNYCSPALVELNFGKLHCDGKEIGINVCDVAGEDRYWTVQKKLCHAAHGVIIAFDVTSRVSFHNVTTWRWRLGLFCSKDVNVMLVATKCDELEKRQVTREEAIHYAALYGINFVETSAKTGGNVKHLFYVMAVEIYNRLVPKPPPPPGAINMDNGQDQEDEGQAGA
ncbi:hypothetical protein KR038_000985, partial [Drosophila bunnanda]